jgi:hypothetical protein
MKKEETHGGARKGAGRKPKFKKETTTIAFRVPVNLVAKVKKLVSEFLSTQVRGTKKNKNK